MGKAAGNLLHEWGSVCLSKQYISFCLKAYIFVLMDMDFRVDSTHFIFIVADFDICILITQNKF